MVFMAVIDSKTIVFVHGLFVNPKSWKEWKTFFENEGFTCYTPANPFHKGDPQALMNNIDLRLSKVNFEDVVNNLVTFIDSLPEKPILIGHSMAGLAVQKLISLNKGVAGVCIDGAAPVGIITLKWSFWKANFPVINYIKGDSIFIPTRSWFFYAFGNTLSRADSDRVFEELVVPESRNIPRGTLKSFAKINLTNPHNPLLFIGGEKDHIVPWTLNKSNFDAYKDKTSIKAFKLFEGRSHFICGEPGWQEVAEYILIWLRTLNNPIM
jgi:pimeloyl-ACP methyl ester carboxylesterase